MARASTPCPARMPASRSAVISGCKAALAAAARGRNDRFDTSQVNYDARAIVSADVRVPTSIGLLRGYMRLGAEMDTPIGSSWMTTLAQPVQSNAPFLLWDRGYIQFAGFTVGKTRSFFDI